MKLDFYIIILHIQRIEYMNIICGVAINYILLLLELKVC